MIDHFERNETSNTRKTAINAMCWQCMGAERGKEPPPGISVETLYRWRPYQ